MNAACQDPDNRALEMDPKCSDVDSETAQRMNF